MNDSRFELALFDPSTMAENAAIVMVAKRGSGKSVLICDIMYHKRTIPCGSVISPTDGVNPFFRSFFPDLYTHYDISEDIMSNIMKRQIIITRKSKEKAKKGLKVDRRAILVMDDCIADAKAWANSTMIRVVMMNGRHYGLTYILAMQDPLGVPPKLRGNFDYVFLLKEKSDINKKKIFDNFASSFGDFNLFKQVLDQATQDFRALVIDNKRPSSELMDTVFWYKAQSDHDFVFGSKSFKAYHNKFYDPAFERKLEKKLIDGIDAGKKNKKVPQLKIRLKE